MTHSSPLASTEKKNLRRQLLAQRLQLAQRQSYIDLLQQKLHAWLLERSDNVIGAYWPIQGEFDPLPVLQRWQQDGQLLKQPKQRQIGLPVIDAATKSMVFHAWHPGCPMQPDAYGIPQPKDSQVIAPTLLLIACLACTPLGHRLGYGGGFYDRLLARARPRPFTLGLGFGSDFVIDFQPEPHDIPLDLVLHV